MSEFQYYDATIYSYLTQILTYNAKNKTLETWDNIVQNSNEKQYLVLNSADCEKNIMGIAKNTQNF